MKQKLNYEAIHWPNPTLHLSLSLFRQILVPQGWDLAAIARLLSLSIRCF